MQQKERLINILQSTELSPHRLTLGMRLRSIGICVYNSFQLSPFIKKIYSSGFKRNCRGLPSSARLKDVHASRSREQSALLRRLVLGRRCGLFCIGHLRQITGRLFAELEKVAGVPPLTRVPAAGSDATSATAEAMTLTRAGTTGSKHLRPPSVNLGWADDYNLA